MNLASENARDTLLPAAKILHNKPIIVKYRYFKPISIQIRTYDRFQNVVHTRHLSWKLNEAISDLPAIQFIFYTRCA
jgi:hypothetical protein